MAAALVALAVFFVHDSRPAAAEHDTSVKELWSATLTLAAFGGFYGCSVIEIGAECTPSEQLTDNTFNYGGASYEVQAIVLGEGELSFQLTSAISTALKSALTLHVGSRQFPLADATLDLNDTTAVWSNTGLSWSEGDTVELKLTRPTFTGLELFGGDLVAVPDSAPTLTVAEGGSATFMVKLTQAPTANVTVSLGRGQIRCAGCGEVWHDDVNAGTVSPMTMTFNSTNWDSGQTVTVTGVADDDSVHEHFQALVWVSSIAANANEGDPFRSPEGALGA